MDSNKSNWQMFRVILALPWSRIVWCADRGNESAQPKRGHHEVTSFYDSANFLQAAARALKVEQEIMVQRFAMVWTLRM